MQIYGEALQTRKALSEMDVVTKKLSALKPQLQTSHPELMSQLTAVESAINAIKSGTPGPPGTISGLAAAAPGWPRRCALSKAATAPLRRRRLRSIALSTEAAKSSLAEWKKLQAGAMAELNRALQSYGLGSVTSSQ